MDKSDRNTGPGAKDRVNKDATTTIERGPAEFDIAGNIRGKDEDPSPDNQDRGERSSKETAGVEDAGR